MRFRQRSPDPESQEAARRRLALLRANLAGSAPPPSAPVEAPQPESVRPMPAKSESGVPEPERPPAQPRPTATEPDPAGRHVRDQLSLSGRATAWLADALPPTFRGRLGVTSHHVTVVALVLSAAMALAAWLVIQSKPDPVSTPRPASLDLPPASAAPAPADSTAREVQAPGTTKRVVRLVVHVAGKVRRPGIVRLRDGSRVIDALQAAGGVKRGVRLTTLNLARPVVDGEQILVGVPGAATSAADSPAVEGSTAPQVAQPVNINTATQAELEELPGIGPVTAAAIIQWRTEHGGFSVVEELLEVSGIGEVTLSEVRDLVVV